MIAVWNFLNYQIPPEILGLIVGCIIILVILTHNKNPFRRKRR